MPLHDLESWMWAEACAMLDRADRLHRQLSRPTALQTGSPKWEPPIDVYETPYAIKILIALPGVPPENTQVLLDADQLIISGKRHMPVSADAEVRRLEIPCGRFERIIQLPGFNFDIGERKFINGCLLISLQKN